MATNRGFFHIVYLLKKKTYFLKRQLANNTRCHCRDAVRFRAAHSEHFTVKTIIRLLWAWQGHPTNNTCRRLWCQGSAFFLREAFAWEQTVVHSLSPSPLLAPLNRVRNLALAGSGTALWAFLLQDSALLCFPPLWCYLQYLVLTLEWLQRQNCKNIVQHLVCLCPSLVKLYKRSNQFHGGNQIVFTYTSKVLEACCSATWFLQCKMHCVFLTHVIFIQLLTKNLR